jgi:hypothetical protein
LSSAVLRRPSPPSSLRRSLSTSNKAHNQEQAQRAADQAQADQAQARAGTQQQTKRRHTRSRHIVHELVLWKLVDVQLEVQEKGATAVHQRSALRSSPACGCPPALRYPPCTGSPLSTSTITRLSPCIRYRPLKL